MKFAAIIFFCASFIFADTEIPQLKAWATDQTGTLSQSTISSLNLSLKKFQDSTTSQVVFLMISTLGDSPVEDFAYETATQNKIGSKEFNNGILFLIVKNDRVVRIEVGYGLEGTLPDATASSIIRNEIIPYLKKDDYDSAVKAGVNAILLATAGEYSATEKDDSSGGKNFLPIIFYIALMLFGLLGRRRRRGMMFGGFPGGTFGGFGGGGGGGFGGFSGGGGSFGGGGASGRW